jgi:aminopeptidase YwaD
MKKNLIRKSTFKILLLIVLMVISQFFMALNPSSNQQSLKLTQLDTKKMISTITALSANSRQFGSSNEKKACEYLNNVLKSYGYKPQIQTFKDEIMSENGILENIQSQNLIAIKKNSTKTKKGIIIIAAHYDCEETSKGANDDATGVAVVLETARLLKNSSSAYELRFVLFGGEEYGCRGSKYYVGNLSSEDKESIKAVIDLDSIAQKNMVNPKIFTYSGESNSATVLLKSSAKNKSLTVNKADKEMSDYVAFDFEGIPALCVGQPYTSNLKINSSQDTISLIDKAKLEYVANMIMNVLKP